MAMLADGFGSHARETENGVEYWLAGGLQRLPGYGQRRNFALVAPKAKTACKTSDHKVLDHFADVGKMVDIGSGNGRKIDDAR